jgi:hypothetical protein
MFQRSARAKNDRLTAEEISSHADSRSDPGFGRQPMEPSGRKSRQVAWERPSIGRRMFRFITRFTIAVLIGIGATLSWQSYGEVAGQMLVAQAPTLAWLVSLSTPKPPPIAATTSTSPTQQLEPLAANLGAMRRGMDQLAARQDEMAQRIAALRAFEEDIRQKISLMPPFSASASQAAPIPQQKPAPAKIPSPAARSSSGPRSALAGPVAPQRAQMGDDE